VASEQKRRGRPRILDDAAILDSALRVFAVHGYEGMSLRSLNSELGLSHGTINQRFGTKEQLYLEAVDHGFSGLLADMRSIVESEPLPGDPLDASVVLRPLEPSPPSALAREVTESLRIPTIGIGAGIHTSGQVLVLHDAIGANPGHVPKFVRNFMSGQTGLAGALTAYVTAVKDGSFPVEGVHTY
jgi:AcrR family transcriptional regulator